MTPYEKLANAIIVQAAHDYAAEYKKMKRLKAHEPPPDPPKPPDSAPSGKPGKTSSGRGEHANWEGKMRSCESELASIQRFFFSQWFEALSDANGPAIFRQIKKEAELS